jgi:hypothetical protein
LLLLLSEAAAADTVVADTVGADPAALHWKPIALFSKCLFGEDD